MIRTGEDSAGYEGWRVALASSVGVFVSFASLLVYTFGILLKPLAQEFAWSREAVSAAFGVAAMTAAVARRHSATCSIATTRGGSSSPP